MVVTTILGRVSLGNRTMIIGKSVITGATSGNVKVPLKVVTSFLGHESTNAQKGFATEEDYPLATAGEGTDVTVHIETSGGTIYWEAIGYRK